MRSVLITGGSSGIGLAVAKRFVDAGDRVLIVGRDPRTVESARRHLGGGTESVLTEACSVAEQGAVERIVGRARGEMGGLDVLVNNAGIAVESPVLETADSLWDEHLAVNLTAPFRLSKAVAQSMVESGRGGVIINTSSVDAVASEAGHAAYCASKAGLESLTRSMALELAPADIRVNCVSPGWVDTPIYGKSGADAASIKAYFDSVLQRVPMGRVADPEEIAGIYTFLASPQASYITGATFVVDGGRLTS